MIDSFMFFNELDLLEIRLNSLAPYIDKFILVECSMTHSGIPKPLYFEENKDRFKDFNITHLIYKWKGGNPWQEEQEQRQFILEGIKDERPESIILVSDMDEFPNLADYKMNTECVFKHKLYYYFLNVFTGQILRGTIAVRRDRIININALFRGRYKLRLPVINGGWHFSYLHKTLDQITQKIEAQAHQEFNFGEVKSNIEKNIKNLSDLYNRPEPKWQQKFSIEMPSGPKWLLENKDRYKHLWQN